RYRHPAPTPILTLSLHDALPILRPFEKTTMNRYRNPHEKREKKRSTVIKQETTGAQSAAWQAGDKASHKKWGVGTVVAIRGEAEDRKSTRLNSSHVSISYAVFCL